MLSPCSMAAACEIVRPAPVTYCVTSSEKLGTAASVIVCAGTKSSCSRYGPPAIAKGLGATAACIRVMVAFAPVATVTLTLPEPAVSCGSVTVAVMPPVAGSVAVVAALAEGVIEEEFDCADGGGSVGVAVGAGVSDGALCGIGDPPPPPPHAAKAAAAANAASTPLYKRYLCIDVFSPGKVVAEKIKAQRP